MPEEFILEENGKNIECRIITSLYSDTLQKHYLIYEYKDTPDEIYVSSYNPDEEEDYELNDVTEEELEIVSKLLEDYLG